MTEDRKFASRVVTVSAAVVAACAVVVTVKVMATGIVSVKQSRVLNQAALEQQVSNEVQAAVAPKEMSCPLSVVVTVGNKFTCRFWEGSNPNEVTVTVVSDQGEIDVGEVSN